MKRTNRILFLLSTTIFLATALAQAQVLSDGQPSVLKEDQNPPNYVYDLKLLIKKSRENIKNVDEKIKEQAVVKRNQKREEKAREYFEQAMKLQSEGRFEEARQIFEKAIRITEHPEMKGYIKESEHRSKAQESALKREEGDQERRFTEEERIASQKTEDAYQVAVSLYKQQKFKEAKTAFEDVEETSPGYKAVGSYLQIVDQDIAQHDNLSVKVQKKEIDRQQKEVEISRLREKELWRKEIEQKEDDRKDQIKKQADATYNEAIRFYQAKKYQEAKGKFQEVEWVVPDFKATRAYLGRIDRDIENDKKRLMSEREKDLEKQRWDEELEQRKAEDVRQKALQVKERERLAQVKDQADFVYTAAVALFEKNNYLKAKEKFDEVESLYPDYKSTRSYLKKVDQVLGLPPKEERAVELDQAIAGKSEEDQTKILVAEAARRKEEKEAFRKISVEVEDNFNQAMTLFNTGHLIEAKEKFLAVDQKVPDYKSTRDYLKRIDDDIELMAKTHKSEQAFSDQQAEIENLKQLKDKADKLYSSAIASFDAKDFARAKSTLQEVEAILPDFKRTKFYLQRVEDEIARQQEELKHGELESKVNVAYAQAVVLFNAGQFEEAKKKFIEIDAQRPNHKDVIHYLERIDDDIITQKEKNLARLKELQVSGPYSEALALYQNRDFETAKARFLEVMAVYPDYRDTAKYLDKIDDDIAKRKQEIAIREQTDQAEALYKQAMERYQAGDFGEAKEKFVGLEVAWPDYKDATRYLKRIDGDIALKKRQEETARQAAEAEPLYDQALSLYKEQEFHEARKKFMQVQVLYPGFRDSALYLARLEKDIQSQEERVNRLERSLKADEFYGQAASFYSERKFEEAKKKFLEAATFDPNHKNLRSYLSRIDGDIRSEAAHQELQAKEQMAAEPYAQAVTLYHDRDFGSAKEKFQETSRILPDYKKTRNYLSRIDQDIREEKKQLEQAKTEKAVKLFREAEALFTAGKLAEAFAKFSEVELSYPDYKNTRALLEDIRSRLAAQNIFVTMPQAPAPQPIAVVTVVPGKSLSETEIFDLYKEAVGFYKEKNYQEAKARFQEITGTRKSYRSTEKYLESINEILGMKKGQELPVKAKQLASPEIREAETPIAKAEAGYREALQLYKNGKYDEAKSGFEQVETIRPGYKSSRQYIILAKAKIRTQEEKSPAAAVQSAKDSEAVQELSKRSEAIYRQIKALSQDKDMANALRTFAQVDRIISNLEAEQKRLEAQAVEQERRDREAIARQKKEEKAAEALNARKVKEEAERLRKGEPRKLEQKKREEQTELKGQEQEKEKQKQREWETKLEAFYQQALDASKDKKYPEARAALDGLEKLRPGYRDSARIRMRLDREEGESKLVQQENKDRAEVIILAEQANAVNLEVVQLTERRNYEEVRKKFDDLSGILRVIEGIKGRMMARRREFTRIWEGRVSKSDARSRTPAETPEKFMANLDARVSKASARTLFREGEQFYSAQKYPEAKVKFLEAYKTDPTFKAAATYVNRINRVLEQHDFEAQKERNARQIRVRERKEEEREGLSAETANEKQLSNDERAKLLLDNGIELYRGKRYREARVRFEELAKIGDEKQCDQAKRYLALVEKGMKKQESISEQDRQAERERYLRERREQERLASGPGGRKVKPDYKGKPLAQAKRDLEIERQKELRIIEKENMAERERTISETTSQDGIAEHNEKVERAKFRKVAAKVDTPASDGTAVKTLGEKKARVRSKIEQKSMGNPLVVPVTEAPPAQAAPAQVSSGQADIKTLNARRGAVRHKQFKRKKVRLTRVEEKYRRQLEQERIKVMREKNLLEKSLLEQARDKTGASGDKAVQPEIKKAIEPEPEQPSASVSTPPARPTIPSDDKAGKLRAAIEHEKQILVQQRDGIRRDFEAGVANLYEEAVALFRKHLYAQAQQDFLQVNDMIKSYKKTDYYLGQIDKALKAEPKKAAIKIPAAPLQPAGTVLGSDVAPSVSVEGRTQAVSQALDSLDDHARR